MSPIFDHHKLMTRRSLFGKAAMGLGGLALGSLMKQDAMALPPDPQAPLLPHFAPKAKRVIYLFQNGGPTHVELFDHKPMLKKWHGKQIPDSVSKGKRFSTMSKEGAPRPVEHQRPQERPRRGEADQSRRSRHLNHILFALI